MHGSCCSGMAGIDAEVRFHVVNAMREQGVPDPLIIQILDDMDRRAAQLRFRTQLASVCFTLFAWVQLCVPVVRGVHLVTGRGLLANMGIHRVMADYFAVVMRNVFVIPLYFMFALDDIKSSVCVCVRAVRLNVVKRIVIVVCASAWAGFVFGLCVVLVRMFCFL